MNLKSLRSIVLCGGLLFLSSGGIASANTTLWGMGVKSCFTFNHAFEDWQQDKPFGVENYPFYREWLMGLASGLSASIGLDVLHGSDPDTALRAIDKICRDAPGSDFFSAAMTLFGRMAIPGEASQVFKRPSARTPEPQKGTVEQPWPPAASMVPTEPTPIRADKETERGQGGEQTTAASLPQPRPETRQSERRKVEKHPRISDPPEKSPIRKELAGDDPQPRQAPPSQAEPAKPAGPAPSIAVTNPAPAQAERQPAQTPATSPAAPQTTPTSHMTRQEARITTIEEPSISGDEIPAIATQKTGTPRQSEQQQTCDDGSSIASNKHCPE